MAEKFYFLQIIAMFIVALSLTFLSAYLKIDELWTFASMAWGSLLTLMKFSNPSNKGA